ncbi:sensor histidine kinase [Labilibacter marinus]|uniref:sensor histidine kinase n=1 Tax=Labilibacter marinus TaxID=1477105 RepID=UPI00094F63B9|nr:HAMP domain-containing sensor histidine kinase [Labilibacter marinus]
MNIKIDKQSLLAGITFAMLLCLIGIQLMFLVKAAKLEQKHFNHRVVLALREARNEIAREANACDNMHNYVCGNQCPTEIQYINFHRADSIISSNLAIHKIELDYTFEFINEVQVGKRQLCVTCYEQSLNGLLEQNGIKLQIEFPDDKQFLFAQAGMLFYISIGAIIFVMISFFFTSRLFQQKKLILSNTKGFIDNMVHEFQTPIANIKLASNLIKKNISQDSNKEKIIKYTQLINSENQKNEDHVKDILSVAAMSLENSQASLVNIHQLIEQCNNAYKHSLIQLNGTLELKLEAKYFCIMGEKEYLHHAICNIIDNAFKYTTAEPRILIKTYNVKNKLIVDITDNGIGIPKKEFQSIFEKYYRINNGNIHDKKGFGLGLNFVKNVVERHKGNIKIKSHLDQGSTFSLSFKADKNYEC